MIFGLYLSEIALIKASILKGISLIFFNKLNLMKSTLLLFILFNFYGDLKAQETIEITYESYDVPEGSSLYDLPTSAYKSGLTWFSIISGDTNFTFATTDKKGKKKYLKEGVYANKPIHHSGYYVSSNYNHFATVAFKGKYFIRSENKPSPKNYWIDTIKTILNYECQAAMIFSSEGDSSTMWIARNVKPDLVTYSNGFVVPGIAMESLDLKYGTYYKAVKVEKTDNKIHFPKDYPQISLAEYRQRNK